VCCEEVLYYPRNPEDIVSDSKVDRGKGEKKKKGKEIYTATSLIRLIPGLYTE